METIEQKGCWGMIRDMIMALPVGFLGLGTIGGVYSNEFFCLFIQDTDIFLGRVCRTTLALFKPSFFIRSKDIYCGIKMWAVMVVKRDPCLWVADTGCI